MKILMVSIFAPHFFNWTEQLRNSGHEIYWLDVFDSNTKVEQLDFVHQIIGWRYKIDYPGRYTVKKRFPGLNKLVNIFNERKLERIFEEKLKEIKPDVVHSFVMYLATAPLLGVMQRYPKIKWIYSSWGSDLYYYRDIPIQANLIKATLPKIDYLYTDCQRDYWIAKDNGFKGDYLGAFPGGGGFDFEITDQFLQPFEDRNLILIKGYQGLHGKCIQVLEALSLVNSDLQELEIVVFGANEEVLKFLEFSEIRDWKNFSCLGKIHRNEVLKLMGQTLIYIGNSSSDGLPNTLLEAIILGAFPLQSDPGGASSELIIDGLNGLLIKDPVNVTDLAGMIKKAASGKIDLKTGIKYNFSKIKPGLERNRIRMEVLNKYRIIEEDLEVGKKI